MDRLTRPGIIVAPTAARFMGAEVKIQDISDKLLHLILNGSTINSINKDTLRHLVRQLYDELSQYENGDLNTHSWIPVAERLPDLIPCSAGTGYSEAVNVLTSGRKVMVAVWDGVDWLCARDYWDAWGEVITHWTPVLLPLPELSKEGTP